MREKPNASNIALESMILYSRNKTASWLQQKEPEKRQELLKVARTLAPAVKENFKRRKQEIEMCREKALAKKQKEIEQKQLHKTQEKEKLIREIEGIGLWKSRTEVECKLKTIPKKTEKEKILKLQIKYRHKVIEQTPPDTSVFKFSHNRKQHSIEQLKQNLYQLFDEESSSSPEDGLRLALDDILVHPELLVGQKIKHRFEEMVGLYGMKVQFYKWILLLMNFKFSTRLMKKCSLLDDIATGDLLLM